MPPDRLCLPIEDWPETDRRLWTAGHQERGLFDATTAATYWAPLSRKKIAAGYGRWLQFLTLTGALDPSSAPGERVTQDRVAAYLRHLEQTCAPYTLMSRMQDLHNAMRLLVPGDDFTWLRRLWETLRARAVPTRQKRQRLRPADMLAHLGTQLMQQAEAESEWSPRRRAVAYRDGLMIALLAYRPVRVKNFASMLIGTHLVEITGQMWMLFAAHETKSKRAYEAIFPTALAQHLQRYLQQHRPVLLLGERGCRLGQTGALWVGETGRPFQAEPLSKRIAMHTEAAFGTSIPPHFFRDAAATTIAIDDPAHIRDAHLVLGHASLATTEQHYIQAQSLIASRRHHAVLANLMQPSISEKDTR